MDYRDKLPDSALLRSAGELEYLVWRPEEKIVVIGNGDKKENSVYTEYVEKNRIPVIKRKTGGHAVVLTPKMIAVSLVIKTDPPPLSSVLFSTCNRAVISALSELGIHPLAEKGISDIALGTKKIAGAAVYRNRNLAFYHSIVNIGEEPADMDKILKYPKKTPEYRKMRPHSDFVTSLWSEGFLISLPIIREKVEKKLAKLQIRDFF